MSLFGDLAGQALQALQGANGQQGENPLIQIAGTLLQQNGGITGLLEKFNSAGLGDQMSSWIGTGANQAVDGAQISDALGHGTIADIAGKLGLPADQISGGLAQMLPQLIDQMTPNGATGGSNDLLAQGLNALGGMFGQTKLG